MACRHHGQSAFRGQVREVKASAERIWVEVALIKVKVPFHAISGITASGRPGRREGGEEGKEANVPEMVSAPKVRMASAARRAGGSTM